MAANILVFGAQWGLAKNVIPQLCSIKIFILKSMYSQLSPNTAKSLPES